MVASPSRETYFVYGMSCRVPRTMALVAAGRGRASSRTSRPTRADPSSSNKKLFRAAPSAPVIAHDGDVPITAAYGVDAAGPNQIVEHRVRSGSRVATGPLHEPGDERRDAVCGEQHGVHVDLLGEHAADGALDGALKIARRD